jgi:hypothetical protein
LATMEIFIETRILFGSWIVVMITNFCMHMLSLKCLMCLCQNMSFDSYSFFGHCSFCF